jgi:hypothetical protein
MNITIESENVAEMLIDKSRRNGRTPDEEANYILTCAYLVWIDGKISGMEHSQQVVAEIHPGDDPCNDIPF